MPLAESHRDRRHAALAFGLALALYAATACRTLWVGDSAEIAAAVAVFGVPHPPGYPLYTLVTGALVHAVPFLEPAFAANLSSALYGAAAVGLGWWWLRSLGSSRQAAWVAAIVLATGSAYWSQCTAAEVYAFDAMLLVLTLLMAKNLAGHKRWLLFGVLVGLWLGHRFVNAAYLPAVLGVAWARGALPGLRAHWRALALGFLLSLVPYAYLPLASSLGPAIDVGAPQTWERFWVVVSGAPYTRHLATSGGRSWLRVEDWLLATPAELGVGVLLVLVALGFALRRPGPERRLVLALSSAVVVNVVLVSRYEVLDIESYYLPGLVALVPLVAMGVDTLRARVAHSGWLAAVLLVVASAPVALGYASHDLSSRRYARYLGEDLLASAGSDGVLVAYGDTQIHALWYLQAVERRAPGVIVLSPGHLHPWYTEQLRARYPSEPWPEAMAGDQLDTTRSIIRALSAKHRVFVTSTVDVDGLLRPAGLGAIQHGLVQEALPMGSEVNVRERALRNARLLHPAAARFDTPPPHIDMNEKSIVVMYALAVFRNAVMLARLGERDMAEQGFRLVMRLRPDRQQRDIEADVEHGLGQTIPKLRLGSQARDAIERLGAVPAPVSR